MSPVRISSRCLSTALSSPPCAAHGRPTTPRGTRPCLLADFFVRSFLETQSFPVPQLLVFHINTERLTGGISDRWPILSTAMVVSLLTSRSLFFDWSGHEAAYAHPNLPSLHNTSWQLVYHRWRWYSSNTALFSSLLANGTSPSLWPVPPPLNLSSFSLQSEHAVRGRTHDYALTFEGNPASPVVSQISSLTELRSYYPASAPLVFFAASWGGKGLTHYFYQSEPLRTELERLGLRQALCHGCLVNFALSINAEVQSMFAPYAWQLARPGTLTVGVQLRMGDVAMKGKEMLTAKQREDVAWQDDDALLLRHAESFVSCARQLVSMHAQTAEQPHLIFIVSDSVRLRSLLSAHLNHTLIIPATPPFAVGHTDTGDLSIFGPGSALSVSEGRRYLQVAAGEQWLLAWCDFLVIDHMGSGFGRSAVLRSLKVSSAWDGKRHQRCDSDSGMLTVSDWEKVGHKY